MKCVPWKPEEDTILRTLLKDAASPSKMLQMLPGRTWSAIQNRSYLIEATRDPVDDIRKASVHLKEAMLDAQVRFANHKGLTLAEAQRFLMGGNYYTPSASPFQTCSIQRLANRIQNSVDNAEQVRSNAESAKIAA